MVYVRNSSLAGVSLVAPARPTTVRGVGAVDRAVHSHLNLTTPTVSQALICRRNAAPSEVVEFVRVPVLDVAATQAELCELRTLSCASELAQLTHCFHSWDVGA